MWPLIVTTRDCGYLRAEAVARLNDFLERLDGLANERQEQKYAQTLMEVLRKYDNFAVAEKVNS